MIEPPMPKKLDPRLHATSYGLTHGTQAGLEKVEKRLSENKFQSYFKGTVYKDKQIERKILHASLYCSWL